MTRANDFEPKPQGSRQYGSYREVDGDTLTAVAVVGPDGNQIGTALFPSFDDLIHEIRQLRLALTMQGVAADLGDFDEDE